GRGGDGCMSFRREKYVARGGPDGGDGGHGGSIILIAREGVNSLADFVGHSLWRAPKGGPGLGSGCHGRNGKDLTLYVPPGTTVMDADEGFVIRDLVRDGDSVIIARGGKGGRGNMHFKTSSNRAPRQRTLGTEGETRHVILELKSIADVGLVGKPNAGKSTLLSRLSRARPEIADYPFTTKYPNLGQVHIAADQSFVLADIPGLIEGASEGVGLGHEFLKHVERAGILVHLVEPNPIDETDPIENYRAIRAELEAYGQELATRPEIVAITKGELPEAAEVAELLTAELALAGSQRGTNGPRKPHLISAVTGQGLNSLLRDVWEQLTASREAAKAAGATSFAFQTAATLAIEHPVEPEKPKKPKRLPPHLAGPTATLSDDNPPSRFGDEDS
ncbi:MAG: GTPase ObgE, partial [Planctomycetales bacterium]|nr:GTPase ObgE [Planctomycetales bacterium]